MSVLNIISTAAATAEASTHEVTIKDAVDDLVQHPEETASKLGEFFQNMWNSIIHGIPTIILAIVVLLLGLIICKLVLKVLSKGLDRTRLDLTVNNFVKQCCKIVLYVLLVTIVLSVLGIPATSIITVIGTAGVAIGLALQDSLSNVAGGIMLLINKPFKIGDYIMVSGAVVTNNNTNGTRRVDLKFSISYEDDYQKAREIILQVLSRNEKILTDPAPTVRMIEHAASSINIAVRPWCKAADYWEVYFSVMEEIRAAFIAGGISIPFDQLDVHVVKE